MANQEYTEVELRKRYGFNWTVLPNVEALDIRIPDWTSRTHSLVRLTAQPVQNEISIAEPGLGQTFNLSYRYIGTLKFHGDGPGAIRKWIDGARGGGQARFGRHPTYQDMVVSAVYIGLKKLRQHSADLRAGWGR